MHVVAHHADDQTIEQRQCTPDNGIVSDGKGIKTPYKYTCSHNSQLIKEVGFHDVATIWVTAEVLVGQFCHHTPSGGALDETLHDEEGLVYLLDGACILTNGGGNGGDAHRTALELVDDGEQDLVVDLVETILVDVQGREGLSS